MKKLHIFLFLLYSSLVIAYCQDAASYKEFAHTLINEKGSKTTAKLLKEFNKQQKSFQDGVDASTPLNAEQQELLGLHGKGTCLEILSVHFFKGKFPSVTSAFTSKDYDNLKNLIIKFLKEKPKEPNRAFTYIVHSPRCTMKLLKAFDKAGLNFNATHGLTPYPNFVLDALPEKNLQTEQHYKMIDYLIDKSSSETLSAKDFKKFDTLSKVFEKIGNNEKLVNQLLNIKRIRVTEDHILDFLESKNINTTEPKSMETLKKLTTAISAYDLFKVLTIDISPRFSSNEEEQKQTAKLEAIFAAIQGKEKFAHMPEDLERYFKGKINPLDGDNNNPYSKYGQKLWGFIEKEIDITLKERIKQAAQAYKIEKEAERARKQEEERLKKTQQEKERKQKEEEERKKAEEQREKKLQEEAEQRRKEEEQKKKRKKKMKQEESVSTK